MTPVVTPTPSVALQSATETGRSCLTTRRASGHRGGLFDERARLCGGGVVHQAAEARASSATAAMSMTLSLRISTSALPDCRGARLRRSHGACPGVGLSSTSGCRGPDLPLAPRVPPTPARAVGGDDAVRVGGLCGTLA